MLLRSLRAVAGIYSSIECGEKRFCRICYSRGVFVESLADAWSSCSRGCNLSRAAILRLECGEGILLLAIVVHVSPGFAPQAGHSKFNASSISIVYATVDAQFDSN